MYKIVKMLATNLLLVAAKIYCRIWHYFRCRLFRRIDDLNYHVQIMSDVDPKLSFYKKMKKVSDVGKDTYVKIGDVLIIYSFVHLAEQSDDLVGLAKWQIFNALRNTSASHKEVAPVVQLKNYNRKDSNVVNRSSS